MTCDRTYRCNLCRDTINDSTGRGVFFGSGWPKDKPHFDYQPVRQVEHHLCERCIAAVLAHDALPAKEE